MASFDVYNTSGETLRQRELSDAFVNATVNRAVIHQCVVAYLANQRRGTASTKTRGEVHGSKRKLYRQKGTGRARVGNSRSPIRVLGGTIFGPIPRSYRQYTPKKVRRMGLHSALADKFQNGDCILIEDFTLDRPRTKDMTRILDGLELTGKVLFVLGQPESNIYLSVNNIPGVNSCTSNTLNVYDVLWHDKIVLTERSAEELEGKFVQSTNGSSTTEES
ncbi:MAG: 50S ribosomal protein L4 [Candidatus Poribacteria bacterium]|nr:50S ribosomal protein L4 [Candidatus Poribacteria bacterium]